jgi:putative aminopeptidase FrvX
MHTQTEMAELRDIEQVSRLMAAFVRNGGVAK